MNQLPIVPIYKNTIQNQQIATRMHIHKRKISEADKCRKNKYNQTSQGYKFLFNQNPKKNYFLQTKYTEIQRQNRLLFQKLARIAKKRKSPKNQLKPFGQMQRMKSLNITMRKKQVQQIQMQNVKIFSRIQKSKPFISFKDTDRQFKRQKKIISQRSSIQKYKVHDWY